MFDEARAAANFSELVQCTRLVSSRRGPLAPFFTSGRDGGTTLVRSIGVRGKPHERWQLE